MRNILPSTIYIEYEQQDGKKACVEALYLAVLNRFYITYYYYYEQQDFK